MVDETEFDYWWSCTMMHEVDQRDIFSMLSRADPKDPDLNTITVEDADMFWDTYVKAPTAGENI